MIMKNIYPPGIKSPLVLLLHTIINFNCFRFVTHMDNIKIRSNRRKKNRLRLL